MATEFQKEKAGMVIHAATVAASAASFALAQGAIFGADTVVLTGIHLGMIHNLGELFNQSVDKQAATVILGLSAGAGIGIAGAKGFLGLIPGWGNAVNAAISATYTEALGWWCFNYFDDEAHGKSHA